MGDEAGIEARKLEVRSSNIQHPSTSIPCRQAGIRASTTTNVNFNLTKTLYDTRYWVGRFTLTVIFIFGQ